MIIIFSHLPLAFHLLYYVFQCTVIYFKVPNLPVILFHGFYVLVSLQDVFPTQGYKNILLYFL